MYRKIHQILMLDPPGGQDLSGLGLAFRQILANRCTVHSVATRSEMLETLRGHAAYQLVVVDWAGGDGQDSGEKLLQLLRKSHPDLPVIAVSTRGDVDTVRRAIGAGATDFMVLGDNLEARVATLLAKVKPIQQLLEQNQDLERQTLQLLEGEEARYTIIGQSPQIRDVLRRIERVASIPRPVLITGERGTGKELVARAIHRLANTKRPIVAVNCAAFSDTLLESELFGYEKGAFTGADRQVKGKFEQAGGSTLFLDEIGFMSLPFQQKILRTVEYGVFHRVGGKEEVRSNARIVAATNIDLSKMMQEGTFLRDLYDRLAFEIIEVPPLRQREGDIELLAQHFLTRFKREIPNFLGKTLSPAALKSLRQYSFPGNVRELKNLIERATYRDTTNHIDPADLGLRGSEIRLPKANGTHGFHDQVEAFKEELIRGALDESGGNQAQAARLLGLSYHQFRYFYRKYSE